MKLEIEQTEIDLIANKVAELLKPLLTSAVRNEEKDTMLDVNQLAAYLNVSPSWIYDRIKDNDIPHTKLGKYLRFRKREIDKWLTTQSFNPYPALKVIKSRL